MSQEVGKPVRLQFSREDEFGWDNYGPAHLADLRAAVDANGKLVAFEYKAWGHTGGGMDTATQLALGTPPPPVTPPGGGFGALCSRCTCRRRTCTTSRIGGSSTTASPGGGYLRTGALRAPMDPSVFFAQEGMMDELAHAARLDPYEFRKRNISHPRWLGVLKAATDAAKWTPRVAASNLSTGARRQRARHRTRHAPPAAEPGRSRHLRGGRRGHRGEQGQRHRHRQTRLWRDGLRAGHQSGDRREPDRRHVAFTVRAWR